MNESDKNKKDIKEIKSDQENDSLNPQNPNKYLLSFLLENSDKSEEDDDPYFKNSDEETNEEQNNKTNQMNINNKDKKFEKANSGKNHSYPNFIENSTIDNSGYNYLNISNNNNLFKF